jgi:hypothetical protein
MIGGQVPLGDIRPRQFQRDMGDLRSLAASIQEHDQRVPILVDAGYEIVDGARRFAVAQQRRQKTILCVATGDYSAMVAHMYGTRRLERELRLPTLAMQPRAIRETLDLFDRFFPRRLRASREPGARIAARLNPALKDDVAGFLGITTSYLRAYRDIYEFEARAGVWPEYQPYQTQIVALIKEWEDALLAGEKISPYTLRGRLYQAVHDDDKRRIIARRSRTTTQKPPAPADSPVLARTQIAAINNALPLLRGTITGLVAMLPVSAHVPREQLLVWEEEYRKLNTAWYQFARNIREELRETSEESTS